MPRRDLTIAMVGAGGDGVVTMGDMLAQAGAREGLNVIKTEAYGPQIRGGESSCVVRLSADPVNAQGDRVDILVVFSWADFARFRGEVLPAPDALVLYEESDPTPREATGVVVGEEAVWVPLPFNRLAKATSAGKNIVTLGILSELFALPAAALRSAIQHKLGKKKTGVLEANLNGFAAGAELAGTLDPALAGRRLSYEKGEPKLLMSGNEACAVGALHAGCRFFAGYPITPSTEVLQFLADWMPKVGGRVIQTEDELSAIGAVVGASYAGVKSATSTSGPGLSLMSETLGLASMAEIPAVVINVQRGGPSTGLPTKSEQSDLWQALWGTHGDAPRVVIAPTDVEDCFHATVDAFNISEEYQLPVLVLSDQSIGQRRETIIASALEHEVIERRLPADLAGTPYARFAETPDGVSPMAVPGMVGGEYQTNGLEHDEQGRPASSHLTHERMSEKRYRKLRPIRDRYHRVRRYGPERARLGIVCWGSSKGPVKEAVLRANEHGESVAAFVPLMMYPFPKHQLQAFLKSVDEVLIVELSYSAQFAKYLRTFMDLPQEKTSIYKRSGGKNLTVEEIEGQILASTSAERVAGDLAEAISAAPLGAAIEGRV